MNARTRPLPLARVVLVAGVLLLGSACSGEANNLGAPQIKTADLGPGPGLAPDAGGGGSPDLREDGGGPLGGDGGGPLAGDGGGPLAGDAAGPPSTDPGPGAADGSGAAVDAGGPGDPGPAADPGSPDPGSSDPGGPDPGISPECADLGIPPTGFCDGDVLYTCLAGSPTGVDCDSLGQICDVNASGVAACVPHDSTGGPCGTIPKGVGICDDDLKIVCEAGQVQVTDCSALGKVCWLTVAPWPQVDCVPPSMAYCMPNLNRGYCSGSLLILCEDEAFEVRDCAEEQKACIWDIKKKRFNCKKVF